MYNDKGRLSLEFLLYFSLLYVKIPRCMVKEGECFCNNVEIKLTMNPRFDDTDAHWTPRFQVWPKLNFYRARILDLQEEQTQSSCRLYECIEVFYWSYFFFVIFLLSQFPYGINRCTQKAPNNKGTKVPAICGRVQLGYRYPLDMVPREKLSRAVV